jgi:hypothetical protein
VQSHEGGVPTNDSEWQHLAQVTSSPVTHQPRSGPAPSPTVAKAIAAHVATVLPARLRDENVAFLNQKGVVMSVDITKVWFDMLEVMHTELRAVNGTVSPNLKTFSQQKISAVVKPASEKNVLVNLFMSKFTHALMTFLNNTHQDIEKRVLAEFFQVAKGTQTGLTPDQLKVITFGIAFPSPTEVAILDHQLRVVAELPTDFYPDSGNLLVPANTVSAVIQAILK